MLRVLRTLSIQVMILAITVAALDMVLFFALPYEIGERFPGYRQGFTIPDVIGRGYPKDYFVAHPERGFDIKPTAKPRTDQTHYMDDYSYPSGPTQSAVSMRRSSASRTSSGMSRATASPGGTPPMTS